MRLFEIDSTITFRNGFVDPVTKQFTQEFLDAGLYVDDDARAFKKWWVNPHEYFENGGAFSLAYHDDKLIGIGTILVPKEGKIYNMPDGTQYAFFGKVGFFVQEQYRRSGVANTLATILEDTLLDAFSKYKADEWTPVVFCSRRACDIVNTQFKKIISDKEVTRRMDQNPGARQWNVS